MKATMAILAVSAFTAITLFIQRHRRDKATKILEGTFERISRTRRPV